MLESYMDKADVRDGIIVIMSICKPSAIILLYIYTIITILYSSSYLENICFFLFGSTKFVL